MLPAFGSASEIRFNFCWPNTDWLRLSWSHCLQRGAFYLCAVGVDFVTNVLCSVFFVRMGYRLLFSLCRLRGARSALVRSLPLPRFESGFTVGQVLFIADTFMGSGPMIFQISSRTTL